jgi:two-component system, NtrC family, sensor histidine kinase HydH
MPSDTTPQVPMHGRTRFLLTWKGNLVFFGLLICVVLAYFYFQAQKAQNTFLENARFNAITVADVVKRNARSALLSQEVITEIMQTFLGNTARFVDYLNNIEAFSSDELAYFAQEAGLAGIRINSTDSDIIEGPPGWLALPGDRCTEKEERFHHLPERHMYCLEKPLVGGNGCIVVGIASERIETLQEQTGLQHLLETLSGLPGIRYVKMEPKKFGLGEYQPFVAMVDRDGRKVADTRVSMDSEDLVLGMDAEFLYTRTRQIWREFFTFSALLAVLGIFFSWLLHRFQVGHLQEVRSFERQLARQHEDAILGRSAASIAHEIRNPLNSIGMGLQRIEMESDDLSHEHHQLIATMLKAVDRTNNIVKDIRRYAGPLDPRKRMIRLDGLLKNLLPLYQRECEDRGIALSSEINFEEAIPGDRQMLEEVLENLIKNSIEAQPEGGFLNLSVSRTPDAGVLTIENGGFNLPAESVAWILEPYYTTKTRGTGLGLAITQRIITAHGGRMELNVPKEGVLRISVFLPLA